MVIANQEVRGQTHAFPADIEQDVTVGEDQQQHGRDEEVEVPKETTTSIIALHVTHGVDVNQQTNAGDQEDEGHRELVQLQCDIHLEPAQIKPGEKELSNSAILRWLSKQAQPQGHCNTERASDRGHTQQVTPLVGHATGAQQDHSSG